MLLEHQSKWSIITTYALDRCLQMEETFLLYRRYNLRPKATCNGCFMTYYQFTRLHHTACNALNIPGKDGTQIDELTGYTILGGKFARGLKCTKLCTPANNGNIGTGTDDFGLSKWYFIVSIWNIFDRRSIEYLHDLKNARLAYQYVHSEG